MSLVDTLTPFISAPWLDPTGRPLPVRALPGRPKELNRIVLAPSVQKSSEYLDLLSCCSGLVGTAIGPIDFTGAFYPKELCSVFDPCLTFAIDTAGRRWITEMSDVGLPGRVWCLFSAPQVAVYVSEDMAQFMATLKERTCNDRIFSWLQDLTAQAHAIWAHRRRLALRRCHAEAVDPGLASWLSTLPVEAYVYDLRAPMAARGWPYGLASRTGHVYRYGREPVFAVVVPGAEGPQLSAPVYSLQPRIGPRAEGSALPLPLENAGRGVGAPRVRLIAGVQACA
jgi:hypothetical protein